MQIAFVHREQQLSRGDEFGANFEFRGQHPVEADGNAARAVTANSALRRSNSTAAFPS